MRCTTSSSLSCWPRQVEARRIGSELVFRGRGHCRPQRAAAALPMERHSAGRLAARRGAPITCTRWSTMSGSCTRVRRHPNWSSGYRRRRRFAPVAVVLERRTGDARWTSSSIVPLHSSTRGGRQRKGHAQLPEPERLARRPARRRPCRPVDLGAGEILLDRMGARWSARGVARSWPR